MQPISDQVDKAKKKKFKKMKQMISDKLQNIKDEDVSDSEQVDLSIELHPIRHYLDDKEEMIEQMFTSLGPTLIQNMLPPLLRTVPIHELKADCLIQLLGMSKKRVNTLIEGKELQSSSDSEFDSDDSDAEMKSVKRRSVAPKQSKAANKKYVINADTLKVSIDDDDGLESLSLSDDEMRKEKAFRKRKSSEKIKKQKKHLKSGTSSSKDNMAALDIGSTSPISISSDNESDGGSVKEIVQNGEKQAVNPKKGKTLLEILELEMRAKAIRSLLKQNTSSQPQPQISQVPNDKKDDLFDPNIKIKTEPADPPPRNPNPNIELDPDIIEIIEPVDEPILVEDDEDRPNEKDKLVESDTPAKSVPAPTESNSKEGLPDSDKSEMTVTNLTNPPTENTDKTDPKSQAPSWTERYLENKETEKLMKTSKMCTNIRKRMKLVRSMQQKQHVKEKVEIPVVIGSISEYKKLVGSDNLNNPMEGSNENATPESSISSDLQKDGDSTSTVGQNEGASVSTAVQNEASDLQNEETGVSTDVQNEGTGVSNDVQNEEMIERNESVSTDLQNEGVSVSLDEQNEGNGVSLNLHDEKTNASLDKENEKTNISPDAQNEVVSIPSDAEDAKSVSSDIQNEGNSITVDTKAREKSIINEAQNKEENEAEQVPSPVEQNSETSDAIATNEESRSPENPERIMESDILEIDIPTIDLDPDCHSESASSSCKTDVSKDNAQTNGTESNSLKEQPEKSSVMNAETSANIDPLIKRPRRNRCRFHLRKVKRRKPEAEIEEGEVSSPDDDSDENLEAPIVIDSD